MGEAVNVGAHAEVFPASVGQNMFLSTFRYYIHMQSLTDIINFDAFHSSHGYSSVPSKSPSDTINQSTFCLNLDSVVMLYMIDD